MYNTYQKNNNVKKLGGRVFLSLLVFMLLTFSTLAVNVKAESTPTAKGVLDSSGNLVLYYDDLDHEGEGSVYSFASLASSSKPFSTNSVLTVTFDESFKNYKPTRIDYLFYGFNNLTSINNLNYFNTSNATNMSAVFFGCSSLSSLDLSNFDTSKVKNMSYMFRDCRSLQSLDLSNFNTSNVTAMYDMFRDCRSLQSLDLSNFNTSNVTDMTYMFTSCISLSSLDLSNFNTSNVTDMTYMFSNCKSLQSLEVSNFNTSNVTNMFCMFSDCSSLSSLDLSNFDTSKVTSIHGMFSDCSSLPSLDVSNFDTSNVIDMTSMFSGCSSLPSLDVSNFDTSNVIDMTSMFSGCSSLPSLDVSNFDTSEVTNMSYMFSDCSSLESLDLSNFNTSNVTNMCVMFYNCNSLQSLDLSNFDTSKVKNMSYMFCNCSPLEELKISDGVNKRLDDAELPMPASTDEHDNCFFMYDKQDNIATYKAHSSLNEMMANSKSGTEDKVFTYKVLPKETLINDVTFVTKYLDKVTYESATSDKALNATLYPVSGTDDHNITYKNKNYLVGTNFDMSDTTVFTCDESGNKKQSFNYTKSDNNQCVVSVKDDYSKNVEGTNYKYDFFLDDTALDHSKYSVSEGSVKFSLPSSSLTAKTYSGKVLSNGGLSTFTLTVSEETKPTPKLEYKVLNTGVE